MNNNDQAARGEPSPSQVWSALVSGAIMVKDAAIEAAYGNFTKHMVAHGAHEVAAAMLNGSGFVMYPRGTHEDHTNEQAKVQQQPEQQHEQPQQKIDDRNRGGLSM